MIPVRIKDYNTRFGQPEEWTGEEPCEALYTRAERQGGHTVQLSAWKPSPIELEALKQGGSVILAVLGLGHPPVYVYASKED